MATVVRNNNTFAVITDLNKIVFGENKNTPNFYDATPERILLDIIEYLFPDKNTMWVNSAFAAINAMYELFLYDSVYTIQDFLYFLETFIGLQHQDAVKLYDVLDSLQDK